MDGIWNTAPGLEQISQPLSRERVLRVATAAPFTPATLPTGGASVSGFASQNPNSGTPGDQLGPHFILSPRTPDGSPHTYGFEFGLIAVPGTSAIADTGDFTVTIWRLVTNFTRTAAVRRWLAFQPQTGVAFDQLWHSFDVNACAIRFQIGNVATDGEIYIVLNEL